MAISYMAISYMAISSTQALDLQAEVLRRFPPPPASPSPRSKPSALGVFSAVGNLASGMLDGLQARAIVQGIAIGYCARCPMAQWVPWAV